MRRKMGWQAAWNGRRAWHTSVPLKFAKRWRMAVNVGLVAGSLRRRLAARCMEAGEAYFFGNKAIPDFHGQEVGAFFAAPVVLRIGFLAAGFGLQFGAGRRGQRRLPTGCHFSVEGPGASPRSGSCLFASRSE